jgi:putative ABC transport system substrate-binding protein
MTLTLARRKFVAALGGAAGWSIAVRAQQPTMPPIGWLGAGGPANAGYLAAFGQGLSEVGYVESRNVREESP